MSENPCVIDQRPTPDGYACPSCASVAAQNLARVVELTPDARAVSWGLSRGSQGAASGKPGSRSPGNDDALDALSEVQNTLTTWARHVAEERGLGIPLAAEGEDQLMRSAEWLEDHVEWSRHRPECDEMYRDFELCARRIRGVVEGPAPRRYLGPCGAEIEVSEHEWEGVVVTEICEGDVYVRGDARTGRCDTCKAEVDRAERQAWLESEVADRTADTPMRARDIAHAIRVNVNTIRTWSHTVYDDRGQVRRAAKLSSYWWDGERYVPWAEPREGEDVKARGPRLHYVADVMALQREAIERKAQRERRDTLATPA